MKLASLKNKERDGILVLVSKDLKKYVYVQTIAKTLQDALDSWVSTKPLLEKLYIDLNNNDLDNIQSFFLHWYYIQAAIQYLAVFLYTV